MDTETKRLFVAIRAPDSVNTNIRETRRELQALLDASRTHEPGRVRWTSDDQLHVTLVFAGAFPAACVNDLSRALTEISTAFPPIEIGLSEPLVKPSRGKPRLLWFPIIRGAENLRELHEQVRARFHKLQPEDQTKNHRDFVPHLTLGRVSKDASPAFSHALRKSMKTGFPPPPPWRVDALELVESALEKGGARHSVLNRFPLDGAA